MLLGGVWKGVEVADVSFPGCLMVVVGEFTIVGDVVCCDGLSSLLLPEMMDAGSAHTDVVSLSGVGVDGIVTVVGSAAFEREIIALALTELKLGRHSEM